MKSFSKLISSKKSILVSSLRARTLENVLFDIDDSVKQGADAFLLHVELLNKELMNVTSIKKIIDSTDKPMMILNYRVDDEILNKYNLAFDNRCYSDQQLNELKIQAVEAGASAVDLPMHSYDDDCKNSLSGKKFCYGIPNEISLSEQAIEKQKQFVKRVHSLGGEILMSSHVGMMLKADEILWLAKEIESRGVDIVKIIVTCKTKEDFFELLSAYPLLQKNLSKPFLLQTSGKYGKFIRPIAPLLGSCMALCHNRHYDISNFEKPLINDFKIIENYLKIQLD